MKVLVFGANGFIGQAVAEELSRLKHGFSDGAGVNGGRVDLLDVASIKASIDAFQPDVIMNCAGVVDNSTEASNNKAFSLNILEAVNLSGVRVRKVIITGSAAEYGVVDEAQVPVSENSLLLARSLYGKSKVEEVSAALDFGLKHGITVVVARIFNPIGVGMKPKFLIPGLLRQIADRQASAENSLRVSRLDALRDYINVRDVARAMVTLAEHDTAEGIYNIGSGVATSNKELIDVLLDESGLSGSQSIEETSTEPEPSYAARADISRMKQEFDWVPTISLNQTVKEIINHGK